MSDAITFMSGFVSGGALVGAITWHLAVAGFRRCISSMVSRRRFTHDGGLYSVQLIKKV